jgi:hypothetical protein
MEDSLQTIVVNYVVGNDVIPIGTFEEYGYTTFASDARSFALGYLCGSFGWKEKDVYLRNLLTDSYKYEYEVMYKGMPHPAIKIRFDVIKSTVMVDK